MFNINFAHVVQYLHHCCSNFAVSAQKSSKLNDVVLEFNAAQANRFQNSRRSQATARASRG